MLDTDLGGTWGQRLEEPMSGQPTTDPAQGGAMPVGAMQANSSAPEPTRPKRASWERTIIVMRASSLINTAQ